MRLIDADDAVFNLMTLPHIHVPLLAAEFLYRSFPSSDKDTPWATIFSM